MENTVHSAGMSAGAEEDFQNIISGKQLVCEYFRRDENGNVESIDTAIDHVDIEVARGKFVGIIGHNGCGKSTLAKNINALLLPSEGVLTVCGMNTSEENNRLPIRRKAGMIFQNPDNQIISSVVEEDAAFGPENLGVPTNEIRERVKKALTSVGMWEKRKSSPNHLSGGQKQRVAIAGVMAMEPECIIFDEATAMLDPEGRRDVLSVARELNREKGVTILWITHYMEELVEADYIYAMDKGKVVMQGTPREVFADTAGIKKHHLSLPQITLLAERLRRDGVALPPAVLTEEELLTGLMKVM